MIGSHVVIWYAKPTPTTPAATIGLLIIGGGGKTVRVNVAPPVPPELVAVTVNLYVFSTVGLPFSGSSIYFQTCREHKCIITCRIVVGGNLIIESRWGGSWACRWSRRGRYRGLHPGSGGRSTVCERALVITGEGSSISKCKTAVPVPLLLVALIITSKSPETCGFPEITPVVVSKASPSGRLEAPKVLGKFVAII